MQVAVVIPAYNEERAIGKVLADIPREQVVEIVVVDNGSEDNTHAEAAAHGACVVREERRGYGRACLAGIAALSEDADVVVFLDGDYSDFPDDLPALLAPLERGDADLAIGSRTLGQRERGALPLQARFGNWVATRLIRLLWGVAYTDLGPFRAVTREALERMRMRDTAYGWTVEMQVKAAILDLAVVEVPVRYRRRIGESKISGTLSGVVRAGVGILGTILRCWNFGRGPGR
jgi:glycosyltransferase involved in cell wall biosynthesis